MMKITRSLLGSLAWVLISSLIYMAPAPVIAQTPAPDNLCRDCHEDMAKVVVAHKNCRGCHATIDPRVIPHSPDGKKARQVVAAGPEMCLACHDRNKFQGKGTHAPTGLGQCLLCHNPHASEHVRLLIKKPVELCLDCHPDIVKGVHNLNEFSPSAHPMGNEKIPIGDPLRPGREFYCGSCHNPHRAEFPKLSRYGSGMMWCIKCHKK